MRKDETPPEEGPEPLTTRDMVDRLLVVAGLFTLATSFLAGRRRSEQVEKPVALAPPPPDPSGKTAPIPEAGKLMLEHELLVRRIWLDRCLIGLLLAVAGLGANWVIESYKARVTENQFYLTKRLETATAINIAISEITDPLFKIADAACRGLAEPVGAQNQVQSAIRSAVKQINGSGILLDANYNLIAERVLQVMHGAELTDCFTTCDVSLYVSQLGQFMTDATRLQVTPDEVVSRIARSGKTLAPLPWSAREVDTRGHAEYFRQNLGVWLRTEAATTPAKRPFSLTNWRKAGRAPAGLPSTEDQKLCRKIAVN